MFWNYTVFKIECKITIGSESNCRSTGREFVPGQAHTFVLIDHEIFSMVIHLIPLIPEGLLSVTRESTVLVNHLVYAYPGKHVVRLTDRLVMTIAVELDIKPKTKPKTNTVTLRLFEFP